MEDALPKCSVKYGRMASNTSGRTGVVALLSRYMRRGGIPIYFTRAGANREHRYRGSVSRRRHCVFTPAGPWQRRSFGPRRKTRALRMTPNKEFGSGTRTTPLRFYAVLISISPPDVSMSALATPIKERLTTWGNL